MRSSKTLHQEFEVPEALQNIIKCFWYNRNEFGTQESSFEVMPDGYAEIIFYFGSSLSISEDEVLYPLSSPFMMGLLNHPAHFSTKNCLEIIGIRCFPWTIFDLLGLSSRKKGVQIFEHPISKLQSVLQEFINTGKIEEAISYTKQYFTDSHLFNTDNSLLSKAGFAIRNNNGKISVNQIAEEACTTVRTLERNFKQSSGHTVKDVAGLTRFEQVRNYLWHHPDTNLAGLAHEHGYTDQSHLTREFKRYSGTTPSAFARKGKKEKLALSNDFVAFVQS